MLSLFHGRVQRDTSLTGVKFLCVSELSAHLPVVVIISTKTCSQNALNHTTNTAPGVRTPAFDPGLPLLFFETFLRIHKVFEAELEQKSSRKSPSGISRTWVFVLIRCNGACVGGGSGDSSKESQSYSCESARQPQPHARRARGSCRAHHRFTKLATFFTSNVGLLPRTPPSTLALHRRMDGPLCHRLVAPSSKRWTSERDKAIPEDGERSPGARQTKQETG